MRQEEKSSEIDIGKGIYMTIGNKLTIDAHLAIAFWVLTDLQWKIAFELRNEALKDRTQVLDFMLKRQEEDELRDHGKFWSSHEQEMYLELLRGHIDLRPWFKDRDWQDQRAMLKGVGSAIHSPDCPMCRIVTRSTSAASTDNGSVTAARNTKKRIKLPDTLVTWDDLIYIGTSAGWNFKDKLFKPFGRQLRLLHEDAPPLHNIGDCSVMNISELMQDLESAVNGRQAPNRKSFLKGKKVPAPVQLIQEPCAIRVAKLMLQNQEKPGRYKPVFTTFVSPYVGIAVAKPIRVRKNRGNIRDFWDWRRHVDTGNDGDIATIQRNDWEGVCGECMVSLFKDRSLTRAIMHSGAPDAFIRLNDDYYEDLLEQAAEAEKNKTLKIFVVEPVSMGELRK